MKEQSLLGYNGDIDAAVVEDIWSEGGTYSWPAAAAETSVVSSDNAADIPAGTGALTVRVKGLGSNFREMTEDAILNGTSVVTLTNQFYRVNSVEVMTAGSGGANVGVIRVKHGATVIAAIPAGQNVSRAAIFTASINVKNWQVKTLFGSLINADAQVDGTNITDLKFKLLTRKAGGVWKIREEFSVEGNADSSERFDVSGSIHLEAGEDVRLTGLSAAANAEVIGGFTVVGSSSPVTQQHP